MSRINVTLPDGMETIDIKINIYGDDYEIPACAIKQEPSKAPRYRITHKTLLHVFRYLCSQHQGLRMESGLIDGLFVGNATPSYCYAGCRISNGDVHRDTFYGETKVVYNSQEAERNNPFVISLNRAQDKAILDFLGLESQSFFKDGTPALYVDVEDTAIDDAAVEHPEQRKEVEEKAEEKTGATISSNGIIPDPLTKSEEQELLASGKQTLKYRWNSEDLETPIESTNEKVLYYFTKSTDEKYTATKNIVVRYLTLRAKKATYDQYMLEQQAVKQAEGGVNEDD